MLEESLSPLASDHDESPRDENMEQQRQRVGPDEGDLSYKEKEASSRSLII